VTWSRETSEEEELSSLDDRGEGREEIGTGEGVSTTLVQGGESVPEGKGKAAAITEHLDRRQ